MPVSQKNGGRPRWLAASAVANATCGTLSPTSEVVAWPSAKPCGGAAGKCDNASTLWGSGSVTDLPPGGHIAASAALTSPGTGIRGWLCRRLASRVDQDVREPSGAVPPYEQRI
jgi:hypothetical protein